MIFITFLPFLSLPFIITIYFFRLRLQERTSARLKALTSQTASISFPKACLTSLVQSVPVSTLKMGPMVPSFQRMSSLCAAIMSWKMTSSWTPVNKSLTSSCACPPPSGSTWTLATKDWSEPLRGSMLNFVPVVHWYSKLRAWHHIEARRGWLRGSIRTFRPWSSNLKILLTICCMRWALNVERPLLFPTTLPKVSKGLYNYSSRGFPSQVEVPLVDKPHLT